jgi:hypothetical protein
MLLMLAVTAAAHASAVGQSQSMRPAYQVLRQNEDWRALADPAMRTLPLDDLKHIAIAPGIAAYLGGDVRLQSEFYRDELWGANPGSDLSLQRRVLLHAGLIAGQEWRFFGELQHAGYGGRRYPSAPVERDDLDLQQAFVEYAFSARNSSTLSSSLLRLGRQELSYGAGRIVSVREGPNARRAFDGALLRLESDKRTSDWAIAKPVRTDPGLFDNGHDDETLWLLHVASRLQDGTLLDVYLVGYDRKNSVFAAVSGEEARASLGARYAFGGSPLTGDIEVTLQGGRLRSAARSLDIEAWSVSSTLRYAIAGSDPQLTVGLESGISSGDSDPGDAKLQTFRAPHPPGRYFGSATELGPGNLAGLRPFITVKLTESFEIEPRAQFYWRMQASDGLYSPPGRVVRAPAPANRSFVGWEPGLAATVRLSPQATVGATLARFINGGFFDGSGRNKDITYADVTVRLQW